MGQDQSSDITSRLVGMGRGYNSIPSYKSKLLAIFSRKERNHLPIIHKVVESLEKNFDVTAASYLPSPEGGNMEIENSKYLNAKQALDSASHIVFFSVLPTETSSRTPFSRFGEFAGYFTYLKTVYHNYARFGTFSLCFLCQDFNGPISTPITMIHDHGSIELGSTSYEEKEPSQQSKAKTSDVYTDHPVGEYHTVRPFSCRFTYARFYVGGEWVDEDTLETHIRKNLITKL